MSTEENKAVVRRFVQAVNQRDMVFFNALLAEEFFDHALPAGMPQGRAGARQIFDAELAAFPDVQGTVLDMVAEGDKVVFRFAYSGTHEGPFLGIAPTGKRATLSGIIIDRVSDGQIVESWAQFDILGLLHQLGALPELGQTPA